MNSVGVDVVYYDCASIEAGAFLKRPESERAKLDDPLAIISGLAACRAYFRFVLADVGPHEAFDDYLLLRELVCSLKDIHFVPRLVTSARHFSEMSECMKRFTELKELGVQRILLRLDERSASELSEQNVANYAHACAVSGFQSELRFDLENVVSPTFLRIARQLETARFYTVIYPKRRLDVERVRFTGRPLPDLRSRKFRVVVNAAGMVFLREHGQTSTREIWVGDLSSHPLPQIINPRRVSESEGADSNVVPI
jgi:hypothetical protein